MHLAALWDLNRAQRSRLLAERNAQGTSSRSYVPFFPLGLFHSDGPGQKPYTWCLLILVVALAAGCMGVVEATRLSTHVLKSPCTIVETEMVDVGTCTLCDRFNLGLCEVYPVVAARVFVTFKPRHAEQNVTGRVWYCKSDPSMNPCQRRVSYVDQLALDLRSSGLVQSPLSPVPCTAGEVFAYLEQHAHTGKAQECFYGSQDLAGEEVWLSMPWPGLIDHSWFEQHLLYPVLLALGGLALLVVLLGCLTLEGVELWASGII